MRDLRYNVQTYMRQVSFVEKAMRDLHYNVDMSKSARKRSHAIAQPWQSRRIDSMRQVPSSRLCCS